jgi:hypothetical protein
MMHTGAGRDSRLGSVALEVDWPTHEPVGTGTE